MFEVCAVENQQLRRYGIDQVVKAIHVYDEKYSDYDSNKMETPYATYDFYGIDARATMYAGFDKPEVVAPPERKYVT